MKVTPPLAMASLAHGDDMRWNANDNGIDFNPCAKDAAASGGVTFIRAASF